ncbi:MAG: ABC transporter permease [Pseudomonadota bacterium]
MSETIPTAAPPLHDYDREPRRESGPRKRRLFDRWRQDPLLPEAGAGGAPLTAVIAVMSFLAVLAMASVIIINQSAGRWTRDLRSEITVQVKGASAAEIAASASAAMRILDGVDGVLEARQQSATETTALLEPWLGKDNASAFLTVPALIEVKIDPRAPPDLELLRGQLAAAAPGASLDDHAVWHDRLETAAQSGQALSFLVFALIMGAACAISVFAARAGLAANHEIVSVLHLVGATDDFIAAEVQRRFFVLGLRGALAGLAAALAALAGAAFMLDAGVGRDSFLPRFTVGGWQALWLLAVPLATCLVTALTARLTVLKTLQRQY